MMTSQIMDMLQPTCEVMARPSLYACAAQVQVPQLVTDDSRTSLLSRETNERTQLSSKKLKNYVRTRHLSMTKNVSEGMKFSEAVVEQRCFHLTHYDEKYLKEVFDLSDIVQIPRKSKLVMGRHNTRVPDVKHFPCAVKNAGCHGGGLKPLKRHIMERAIAMHEEALHKEQLRQVAQLAIPEAEDADESNAKLPSAKPGVFITENEVESTRGDQQEIEAYLTTLTEKDVKSHAMKSTARYEWDVYLMSMLSKCTANWIVQTRLSPGSDQHTTLKTLLTDWYGEAEEQMDLIRDDISEKELEIAGDTELKKTTQKQWKKPQSLLLEQILEGTEAPSPLNDSEEEKVPFYRQPAGIRRKKKEELNAGSGAMNVTAQEIEVKSYQPPPPKTLRDFLNPGVGDKFYDTSNKFQQEQLAGTEQLYEKSSADRDKIIMSSRNEYQKQLQTVFPRCPKEWGSAQEGNSVGIQIGMQTHPVVSKVEKGLRRWKALPEPIDNANVVPAGYDGETNHNADPAMMRIVKQNTSLGKIIEEWRSKWHLNSQYEDSNPDDLIRDMAAIQPHVRLKAVATVGKAATYRAPNTSGIQLNDSTTDRSQLPAKVYTALQLLLDDSNEQVKRGAAITLFSLKKHSEKAEEILRQTLRGENTVDRWAAAQCLAHFGISDSDVICELIRQLLNTEDSVKHEQAISLLSSISQFSSLVHSLVAEQLNSSSWRHKVIACKVLATLHAGLNKDIVEKLTELMWTDWHTESRRAAAQCLGKTGHGRMVHDDLGHRMIHGDERTRVEALSKVGHLGIMTARLLPPFLRCFQDEFVSVRSEACITGGNLQIQDEQVLEKLVHLATYDTVWKVKALSIQALGKIGVLNDSIHDCLLWAMRYEDKPGVRAEACHSMLILGIIDEDVAEILQDRLLVESNPLVRDEILSALATLGIDSSDDMAMVVQVKSEVRKLCTKELIASQIIANDLDEEKRHHVSRLIYQAHKQKETEALLSKPTIAVQPSSSFDRGPSRLVAQIKARGPSRGSLQRSESESSTRISSATVDSELEAILSREDTHDTLFDAGSPTRRSMHVVSSQQSTEMIRSPSILLDVGEFKGKMDLEVKDGESAPIEKKASIKSTPKPHTVPSRRSRSKLSSKSKHGPHAPGVGLGVAGSAPRPSSYALSAVEAQTTPNQGLMTMLAPTGVPDSTLIPVPDGRLSRFAPTFTPSRRALQSREAQLERGKVAIEACKSFGGLNQRYSMMIETLNDVDDAFAQPDHADIQAKPDTPVSIVEARLGTHITSTESEGEFITFQCTASTEKLSAQFPQFNFITPSNTSGISDADTGREIHTQVPFVSICQSHESMDHFIGSSNVPDNISWVLGSQLAEASHLASVTVSDVDEKQISAKQKIETPPCQVPMFTTSSPSETDISIIIAATPDIQIIEPSSTGLKTDMPSSNANNMPDKSPDINVMEPSSTVVQLVEDESVGDRSISVADHSAESPVITVTGPSEIIMRVEDEPVEDFASRGNEDEGCSEGPSLSSPAQPQVILTSPSHRDTEILDDQQCEG